MPTLFTRTRKISITLPQLQAFSQCGAQRTRRFALYDGIELNHWQAHEAAVLYENELSHTLSYYLRGGNGNYRFDQKHNNGLPHKFSLMPQAHQSKWQVKQAVEFAHIYISDAKLKSYACEFYDYDARLVELMDKTYVDDNVMTGLFLKALTFGTVPDILAQEQLAHRLIDHVLRRYRPVNRSERVFTGGLSGTQRRILKSVIVDNLEQKLSITFLAKHVGLSPFHFCRLFKQSFGLPPAQYITQQRIGRVKSLLKTPLALDDIAYATEFSHQSHMTQCFKVVTGITPKRYQQALLTTL